MGSKEVKAGKSDEAVFRLFSNGYKTKRDAYLYNFSREACEKNARAAVDEYMGAMQDRESDPNLSVDDAVERHSAGLRWDPELAEKMRRGQKIVHSGGLVRTAAFRPFVKQYLYGEPMLAQGPSIMNIMFPSPDSNNRAICVDSSSSTPLSCLVVDKMPDLHFVEGQCFPRYRYVQTSGGLFDNGPRMERVDNITDTALGTFHGFYENRSITKDDMFNYVYGVLHAPDYRIRFANDLSKELPRIPMAPDFHAFAVAGERLAGLHLGYETCEEYPLEVESRKSGGLQPEHFRITGRKMKLTGEDKSELIINDHIGIKGIPAEAHRYQVNGRTPLEWFIDRYYIKQDRASGIINDPNGWWSEPEDLVAAIRRIVFVSVETERIIADLPVSLE